MGLTSYHAKRNFAKTSEPYGKQHKRLKHPLQFVVQKHAASHLHYDFRLELNGVLKSWAIPKGPSLNSGIKRLAVQVKDHPLEYGSFEGAIPQGEYGGGKVLLWDSGFWESQDPHPLAAYQAGNMTFRLEGQKLKGLWKLTQIKHDPNSWLLIKIKDEFAKSKDYDITLELPLSVKSGLSLEEISPSPILKQPKSYQTILEPPTIFPEFIAPELATLVDKPPLDNEWLHEIKFDGYRLLCFINKMQVKLMTRSGQDWTKKFPDIVQALKRLKLSNAILDGEVVALNENQQSDFQELQNALKKKNSEKIVYYVFDMMHHNDMSLVNKPLIERKELLAKIMPSLKNTAIRYSDHVIGSGNDVFKKACKLGLEGIVSKKLNSLYLSRRTDEWLKVKCTQQQEFIVVGYTKPTGKRQYFGSLVLAVYSKKDKLDYFGRVGTGFNQQSLASLFEQLRQFKTDKYPFEKPYPGLKNVTWVKPSLVAEVVFTEWTRDGVLRHPSFKGIRMDKSPNEVVRELPKGTTKIVSEKKNFKKSISFDFDITNPERVLFSGQGLTKIALAEYYWQVKDWILPHIVNRPLTLVRCPSGQQKKCFYQKHITDELADALYSIEIKEQEKSGRYIYIQDIYGLIALVQLGVLEIHPWGSKVDNIERPDQIVFDLDPAEGIAWPKVIKTAHLIHERLAGVNLKSFVKTTGGKGLHVVVPIKPIYDWQVIKDFSHAFVRFLVEEHPNEYTDALAKIKRKDKIFIDYLRNQRGSTAIAVYSTRAKENSPIAAPLSWNELTARIKSTSVTVKNFSRRIARLTSDPWSGFFDLQQELPF